jgi:alkylation response protein AidB-like acyl-CoA dehydrogenase
MDFEIPEKLSQDISRFDDFVAENVAPDVAAWYKERAIPQSFFRAMGDGDWYGFMLQDGRLVKETALRAAMVMERLAVLSPGVGVAALAQVDLGLIGLWLFGSEKQQSVYAEGVLRGETLMCLGHTEAQAGSDAANMATKAEKTDGGWRLSGTKAYVTNGAIAGLAIITAVTDPAARKNNRLSMFLVDLAWIPSDLTRIQLTDVFVPEDHLLGKHGRGLQQVLTIFTHSRVPISALTVGTARGAFEMAIEHAEKREIFGKKLIDFETKRYEAADLYAKIEAARLMVWKACSAMDQGKDFRLDSSLAKYLSVMMARPAMAPLVT